jgi:hypothetical protein
MNVSTIGADLDANKIAAPVAECRMVAPPGPTKPVRIGRTSYSCAEGVKVRVDSSHRAALLRHGWSDAA